MNISPSIPRSISWCWLTRQSQVPAEDYFRAKFVIEEKDRVLAVCDALEKGDYETVGKKMYETHAGLSKDYEVSCEELDFLNDVAKEMGVTGSRIMAGGFGGCGGAFHPWRLHRRRSRA